eukprot:jgi/Astpho2/4233/Aster-x0192
MPLSPSRALCREIQSVDQSVAHAADKQCGWYTHMIPEDLDRSAVHPREILDISVHTATHFDAPSHYLQEAFEGGKAIESIDLNILIGPALVVETPHDSNITAAVLESLNIPPGTERVLFKTLNTARNLMYQTAFQTDYTALTEDGAEWVAASSIKFVGIDYARLNTATDIMTWELCRLQHCAL